MYVVTPTANQQRHKARLHILGNNNLTLCGQQVGRIARYKDWGRLQCSTCLDVKARQEVKSNAKS